MKGFQKLALTTAILAASTGAFAMEAMDDSALSATTGQDGITIQVSSSNITDMDITWADRDGHTTFTDGGSLVINNVDVAISNLNIVVDAGSEAVEGAQLNIAISTTDTVTIGLGNTSIDVATAGVGSAVSNVTPIIAFNAGSQLVISGGLSANLNLGQRAAGEAFMTLSTSALTPFDISLSNFVILDAEATATNGVNNVGIGVGTLTINDVVLNNAINVVDAGLSINTAGTTIGEIALEGVVLGDQVTASSIGDLYLNNVSANTILTISGH